MKVAACLSPNIALALGIKLLVKFETKRKRLPCKFCLFYLIPRNVERGSVGGTVGKEERTYYKNYFQICFFYFEGNCVN